MNLTIFLNMKVKKPKTIGAKQRIMKDVQSTIST